METIDYIYYNERDYRKIKVDNLQSISFSDEGIHWIDIEKPTIDLVVALGKKLNIHSLLLEDILNTRHRPKMEYDQDMIFIIGKTLNYSIEKKKMEIEQLVFILKDNILVTIKEKEIELFAGIEKRLEAGLNIRRNKVDYLLYESLDAMVDEYFLSIENIDEELDNLEDELMDSPSENLLHKIYDLKREMIYLRTNIWPLRNIISSLTKNDFGLIKKDTEYYLRDIHDHIIQIVDIIETYRDILSGMLDTYLSSIGNKTNEVMKVLTVFSTIFIPLTFLSGVYGTNFPNIPIFEYRYAYPLFLTVNFFIVIVILVYLRKKDWF